MSQLGNAKIMGGIGALLMLIGGFIPTIGIGVVLAGLILLFIAVKYIADETKDESIFKNFMLYFIVTIIAVVAMCAILFATFISVGGFEFINTLQSMDYTNPTAVFDYLAPMLAGIVIALVIGWILIIVSALFLRKSYNKIAEHTNVNLFKTTGLIYLIGACTLIILIGALILLVAKIIEIIAFFSIPEQLPQSTEAPKQPGITP